MLFSPELGFTAGEDFPKLYSRLLQCQRLDGVNHKLDLEPPIPTSPSSSKLRPSTRSCNRTRRVLVCSENPSSSSAVND
jgi:hypothetical protein